MDNWTYHDSPYFTFSKHNSVSIMPMNFYSINLGIKCVLIYKLLNTSEWTQNLMYRSSQLGLHLCKVVNQCNLYYDFPIFRSKLLYRSAWLVTIAGALSTDMHQRLGTARCVSVPMNKAVTRKRALSVWLI